jgi:hypothetical protein
VSSLLILYLSNLSSLTNLRESPRHTHQRVSTMAPASSNSNLLSYWLLLMASLASFNTFACYTGLMPTAQFSYPLKPSETTPLATRLYGTWTAVSASLRFIAVYRPNDRGLLLAVWWSFLIANVNFILEVVWFGTATWESVSLGLFFDISTVLWIGAKLFL